MNNIFYRSKCKLNEALFVHIVERQVEIINPALSEFLLKNSFNFSSKTDFPS